MHHKLDTNLETNEFHYYFSFLNDRFTSITDKWTEALSRKSGKAFKPIYLLPFKHNSLHEEANYIVVNERLPHWQAELGREDIFELIYPEDMNKQFSKSPFIKDLINKLLKKQEEVYLLPFSSVWLDLENPHIKILGPHPEVATIFDDKVEHIRVFKRLGLQINTVEVYAGIEELKAKWKIYPFFFSAAFSSGGFESQVVETEADLIGFYDSLRPVNKNGPFIAAKLLPEIILAPNVSAMVTGLHETSLVCISDQLLRGNNYMGNIYPSQSSPLHKKIMETVTVKIGNYMSALGFRGMFGIDFLISKDGSCFPTDINPRRQGGYYCNVMMAEKSIVDMELAIMLGEKVKPFTLKEMDAPYAWAHHKLTPYYHNVTINTELLHGKPSDPFETVGSSYYTIYYPKDYILLAGNPGFYAASEDLHGNLLDKVTNEVDALISQSYTRVIGMKDVHKTTVQNKSVEEIIIKPFHLNELEAVERILKEYVKDPNGRDTKETECIKKCIKGEMDSKEVLYRYFVAHDTSGKVLGVAGYSFNTNKDIRLALQISDLSQVGELRNMFIKHDVVQGGGVGQALFDHICKELKNQGKEIMFMESGIRYHESWSFFEKMCKSPGVIIPNKYGPGWHTKAWKINL